MKCARLVVGLTAGCIIIAVSGCGTKLVRVSGTLTMDGEPLGDATVVFTPDPPGQGKLCAGPVDEDGHFQLHTDNPLGAFPGKYKVHVYKVKPMWQQKQPEIGRMPDAPSAVFLMVPPEYTSSQTSPLRADIPQNGTDNIEIRLDSHIAEKTAPVSGK